MTGPEGRTTRPLIMGTKHMVSSGHHLASLAGLLVLEAGGNAIDAGVATGLCINVVQPDMTNLGGVAPILLFRADRGIAEAVSGLGWWPRAAHAEYFHRERGGRIGTGIMASVIPAAVDAWLTALERHGTMSLAQVAAPAIRLAEQGFPMYQPLHDNLDQPAVRQWPTTCEVFLPGGRPPPIGARIVQHELAATLRRLVEAESGASSREAGIRAARERFYRGDIAEQMVRFSEEEGGWLTLQDLAEFRVGLEPPLTTSYRGCEVLACGPWCQGPVVLQTLNILEGYDLGSMHPLSAGRYHLILESLKAAFADRDRYYGDPRFVDVPIDGLLSTEYAAAWRDRILLDRAAPAMPEPGEAWAHSALRERRPSRWRYPQPSEGPMALDTSYLCVVDQWGNAFSATPSDALASTPLVPGLGLSISSRGRQSWVDSHHPSCLEPGKRPRLTPNPGLVLKDGRLAMAYGTPGGDMQPQTMVQFLVNVLDHGLDLQRAAEMPFSGTYSFPNSFDPHAYHPGLCYLEDRVPPDVPQELQRMGHRLELWPAWGKIGSLCAIEADHERGVLRGAADPRRTAYAIGH